MEHLSKLVVGLLVTCSAFSYQPYEVNAQETLNNKVETQIDGAYPEYRPDAPVPEKPHLTRSAGVFEGPSGKETYYNLPMGRCIQIMRDMGYSVEEYPFWIREDGAKMLGDYVMCAANLNTRPKGTIVETSLGQAIVVDTGGFASSNPTQLDMCTDW